MQSPINQPICFVGFFTKAGYWYDPVSPVTATIRRRRADTGAAEGIATGVVATSVGHGVFVVEYTPAVAGVYSTVFETADTDATPRAVVSTWIVGGIVFDQLALINALSSEPDPDAFAPFSAALGAQTDVRFLQPFALAGVSIAAWTQLVFTIKTNADTDEDADALLVLRATNPPDSTDGIIWHRGKVVAFGDPLQTAGGITVSATSPDATFSILLSAVGMNLPPTLDVAPDNYEIDVWVGGDKRQIAAGDFSVGQSVRRSVVAP